jgi:hypothetical protein
MVYHYFIISWSSVYHSFMITSDKFDHWSNFKLITELKHWPEQLQAQLHVDLEGDQIDATC